MKVEERKDLIKGEDEVRFCTSDTHNHHKHSRRRHSRAAPVLPHHSLVLYDSLVQRRVGSDCWYEPRPCRDGQVRHRCSAQKGKHPPSQRFTSTKRKKGSLHTSRIMLLPYGCIADSPLPPFPSHLISQPSTNSSLLPSFPFLIMP